MENDILITKSGKVIETLGGATHEITCLHTLKCTLADFIDNKGCRVKQHNESLAIESTQHLTNEQTNKVNSILRQENIYTIHTCIMGVEHWQKKFRPIRGLCAEIR